MDDDLDAFFDDVENAVKEVQETTVEDVTAPTEAAVTTETEERPAKRSKVVVAASSSGSSAAKQPVKAVVASSVPVISIVPPLPSGLPPANTAHSPVKSIHPPPPPPVNTSKQSQFHSQQPNQQTYGQQQQQQQQQGQLPYGSNQATTTTDKNNNGEKNNSKQHIRSAAGQTWTDPTLDQWPENDFRLFVGNLAKDLKQHHLEEAFSKYPSFAMARIMFNKTDGKSRGYGFVSVMDPKDCARAIREMDQSWLGSRPIKVKRSEWKDREWKEVQKKGKQEKRYKKRFV